MENQTYNINEEEIDNILFDILHDCSQAIKPDSTKLATEEDILVGAIASNLPVFLHGKPGEGKSSRVKQIDPDCTILYLGNINPIELSSKSVYNDKIGEIIDIKPTWLVKLEEKCQRDPDKIHILFFDELTNALPAIQGMACNIILDKEVDGKWKLPDNVRIVAAGNEVEDSLSANPLSEPLYDRFVHINIKTTPQNWLEWAMANNIHSSIISYLMYRNWTLLRTPFTGETPNVNPRKWEMASNLLKTTRNPYMLRSIIGPELTEEFIAFCSNNVIVYDSVINGTYDDSQLNNLTTSQKYASVYAMLIADEQNIEIVRDFVYKLGNECGRLFDNLWSKDNIYRIKIIEDLRLKNKIGLKRSYYNFGGLK